MLDCLNPNLIVNRAVVPFIVQQCGFYLNNKWFTCYSDPLQLSPYKLGLAWYRRYSRIVYHERVDNTYIVINGMKYPVFITCDCGHCEHCRINRSNNLANRFVVEQLSHKHSPLFVTLTYDDEHLPANGVDKTHLQTFYKRLRNLCDERFRYFCTSEYGSLRGRPHYHMLLFGLDTSTPQKVDDIFTKICMCWSTDRRSRWHSMVRCYRSSGRSAGKRLVSSQFGMVDCLVTDGRKALFKYVSKYISKKSNVPDGQNPNFVLRSLGLGRQYIDDHKDELRRAISNGQINFAADGVSYHLDSYMLSRLARPLAKIIPVAVRRDLDRLLYFIPRAIKKYNSIVARQAIACYNCAVDIVNKYKGIIYPSLDDSYILDFDKVNRNHLRRYHLFEELENIGCVAFDEFSYMDNNIADALSNVVAFADSFDYVTANNEYDIRNKYIGCLCALASSATSSADIYNKRSMQFFKRKNMHSADLQ